MGISILEIGKLTKFKGLQLLKRKMEIYMRVNGKMENLMDKGFYCKMKKNLKVNGKIIYSKDSVNPILKMEIIMKDFGNRI